MNQTLDELERNKVRDQCHASAHKPNDVYSQSRPWERLDRGHPESQL